MKTMSTTDSTAEARGSWKSKLKHVKIYIIRHITSGSEMQHGAKHRGSESEKLTSRANLFDWGEFLLALHGERAQIRLHVLQQFLHRFGTARRHLWRCLRQNSLKKLYTLRNAGAQSPPTHPPLGYNPLLLYSLPLEKKIKTPRSIDTVSHFFSASGACAQEGSDDTGIRSPSSQHVHVSFEERHRYSKFLFL